MSRIISALMMAVLSTILLAKAASTADANPRQIVLTVDATEAPKKILHVTESVPVKPGPLTLHYPKWIPGEHGPTGPIVDLSSLIIKAGEQVLSWRRDPVDMYAIHLVVPGGTNRLELTFDFLLSAQTGGFTSGAASSDHLAVVNWNQVVLSPGEMASDQVLILPRLKLPAGWRFATALEVITTSGSVVEFTAVSLTILVDSPVLMGVFFRQIDITPPGGVSHTINLAADGEAALEMPTGQIEAYKRLVLEANALFGARHYRHYDFLVTLSSQVAHFGLEHHESSDNRMPERTLIDSSLKRVWAMLLPHEYAHSWNGKHRRPAGLSPKDFQKPLTGELLWVYEGLTHYLGELLAVRSGVSTPEDFRSYLALVAARLDNQPGRAWRSLQDVSDAAQILYGSRSDWQSLRRTVDFYEESYLIWLEVEVTIRKLTDGKKSLTDFLQKFCGGVNSGPLVRPFTYDELLTLLNEIVPYDWRSFWTKRLQSKEVHAPLNGIEQSGWKLAYASAPTGFHDATENFDHTIDARFSLGLYLKDDGWMNDVIPGSPAAAAGLAPGMKLVAINGRKFSKEVFRDALRIGMKNSAPLEMLASNDDYFKTAVVNYHEGERYPYLVRDSATSDLLSEVARPLSSVRNQQNK